MKKYFKTFQKKTIFMICLSSLFLSFIFFSNKSFSASHKLQTDSNEVVTRVGNPPETNTSNCWPTSGLLTQGPLAGNHAAIKTRGDGDALDIAGGLGTPIYATSNGAASVFYSNSGLGYYVVIAEQNTGSTITYAHFSVITIQYGLVEKGQQLGLQGMTGQVFGAGDPSHLHWVLKGIPFAPPHIPQEVSPLDCAGNCTPRKIEADQTCLGKS